MFKRQHYVILSLVLVLVLIAFNLPSQTATHLKLALGGLFLPLFGLAGATQNLAEHAGAKLISRGALENQLSELRRENQRLQFRVMQDAEAWRENDQLRRMLAWQKQAPWKLTLARVIAGEPANWWRTLQINRGTRDGIRTNLAVLTTDGLVGRIVSVGMDHAQVVLLGDPNCLVSALIARTKDNGVIGPGGAGILNRTLVNLTYLPSNSASKPGDWVVTSGLGIFPKGIPIGQILELHMVDYGLYAEGQVKLAANLDRLEEVWVLLP